MKRAVFVLALLLSGCPIQQPDYTGLECQRGLCPDGYYCDGTVGVRGLCMPGTGPIGGRDAGFDAGPPIFRDGGFDAGTDASIGNGCAGGPHIFCDDFESGNLDRWRQRVVGDSSVTITDLVAHSGTYGVRTTSAPTAAGGFGDPGMIFTDVYAGMSLSEQWVRAWFLFQRGTGQETALMTLSDVSFDTVFEVGVNALDQGGFNAPYDGLISDVYPITLAEDTWFCVEVQLVQGSDDGSLRIFFNTNEVASRVGLDTQGEGVLPHVAFGAWHFAPSGARLVFIDDIVLSDRRIGCD